LAFAEERGRKLERKLEREGERVLNLQGELAAMQARLDAEASKTEALQDAVARAVAARSRAELELEFAQQELDALKQRSVVTTEPDAESDPAADQTSPDS